jgi:glycosyltransferase involved in cell wall biosynthesis
VVIPVYNEAANLSALWSRLRATLEKLERTWEVILVDDGSADESLAMLREIAASTPGHVHVV